MLKRLFDYLPIEFYIASRYVSANLRQSLIIMLAVGIGVALIVFIPSVNLSFFNYFLDKTVQNAPHITLTRELETMPRDKKAVEGIFKEQNRSEKLLFSDRTNIRRRHITAYKRLLSQLESMPDVIAVSPTIREQVIAVHGSQNRSASLQGIIPQQENIVSHIEDNVAEGNLEAMGPNEVFIGSELANELNLAVGDRIQVLTAFGERSYKIAGLITTGVYQQDLTILYMPLQSAQKLLDMDNEVSSLGLKIRNIYDAENVARLLANTYHLKARSWMEENKIFLDQISNFRVIIAVINFLIVFAAATSINSILIMVVASKSKEIGILKAMGTGPGAIMRLFIAQGIFLSVMGIIAGIAGGGGLIALYNLSPMARGQTLLGIERPPTTISTEYAILAVIYALISSMLASLLPAWRASRLDPVEAINQ